MVSLDPRPSGKLDQVIEIVRAAVVDPEGDDIRYSVKRSNELVTGWQVFGFEIDGNLIKLHLDVGLNQDFSAAVGTFPSRTDIFYRREDGAEDRYTVRRFHAVQDAFDYTPVISPDGSTATFEHSEDLVFVPGVNQAASGAISLTAELDRPFDWPEPNVRSILVSPGYAEGRDGGLKEDTKRKAWARLEANRVTADGRELELAVADDQVEVGDVILFGGARLIVGGVEAEARSEVRRVTASTS